MSAQDNQDDMVGDDLDVQDFDSGAVQDGGESYPPVKKSGGLFNVILILLAVVGGGALVYFKVLGGQMPGSAPQQMAAAVPAPSPLPGNTAPPLPMPDASVTPPLQGSVPAIDAVDMLSLQTNDPVEDPMAPIEGAASADIGLPPAIGMGGPVADSVSTQEDEMLAQQEDGGDLAALLAGTSVPQENNTPVIPSNDAASKNDMPVASSPVTSGDLPMPENDVLLADSLPLSPEVSPSEPVVTNEEAPELPVTETVETALTDSRPVEEGSRLAERLDTLESEFAKFKETVLTKEDLAALEKSLSAKITSAVPEERKKDPVRSAKKEVENYQRGIMPDIVKVAPEKASRATGSVRAASGSATVWVLKSAKPGVAWIAEKGSQELKTVAVGDSVSGLGRITAITQDESGKWRVDGTRGKINQ